MPKHFGDVSVTSWFINRPWQTFTLTVNEQEQFWFSTNNYSQKDCHISFYVNHKNTGQRWSRTGQLISYYRQWCVRPRAWWEARVSVPLITEGHRHTHACGEALTCLSFHVQTLDRCWNRFSFDRFLFECQRPKPNLSVSLSGSCVVWLMPQVIGFRRLRLRCVSGIVYPSIGPCLLKPLHLWWVTPWSYVTPK